MPDPGLVTTRTLLLVRHAEAESWASRDVERALTPRGIEMARALGLWLREHGTEPDVALVSGATRTRQTWAALVAAAGWTVAPTYDDGLYSAGPDTALDLIRFADPDARTLLVLGHNPTVHFLAQVLSDGTGDPALAESLMIGFPPASAAVLDFAGEWAAIGEGHGTLKAVRPGR